jgi:hypothetical protein
MKNIFTNCSTKFIKSGALAAVLTLGLAEGGVSQNISISQDRIFDPTRSEISVPAFEKMSAPSEMHFREVQTQETIESQNIQAVVSLPGKSQNYIPATDSAGEWTDTTSSVYEYDAEGKLLKRYYLDPVTNDSLRRNAYAYNKYGRITESIAENWNNGNWQVTSGYRYDRTYNDQGHEIEFKGSNFSNGVWEDSYKFVYIYDDKGNKIEYSYFNWKDGVWDKRAEYNFTYHDSISSPTSYTGLMYDNNLEVARYKNDYIFDEKDRTSGYIFYNFIYTDSSWAITSRANYVYDENGGYVNTSERFTDSVWVLSHRSSIYINSHKNFTGIKSESYIDQQWKITYESQYLYTYNDNNDIVEQIYRDWDYQNKVVKNASKDVYSDFQYFTVAGAADKITKLKVSAFPNPTTGLLTIQGETTENTELQINDLTGRLVVSKELSFGNSHQLDLSTVPAGIYILNIKSSKGVYSSKIVKQ